MAKAKAKPEITDEMVTKATDTLMQSGCLGAGNASRDEMEAIVRAMLTDALA